MNSLRKKNYIKNKTVKRKHKNIKHHKDKKKRVVRININERKKMKGGNILNYTQFGIPEPLTLVEIKISDQNLCNFRRYMNSQMDCLINAMQLMGLIDSKAANLVRISSAGTTTGFTIEQISSIFILYTNKFCLFRQMANFNAFATQLTKINPGTVALGGYTTEGLSHVFLIGKTIGGEMVYIDPRETISTYCNLSEQQCLNILSNKNLYYLLYHNDTKLTLEQFNALGFINQKTYQQICPAPVLASTYQSQPAGISLIPIPPNPVNIQKQMEISSSQDPITTEDVAESIPEPMDMETDTGDYEYDML